MSSYKLSRREFFKQSGLVCAGFSGPMQYLFNLNNLGALSYTNASKSDDYKALVCVFLGGGADSFNMLIPRGQTEYQEYNNTRTNLSIAQNEILPISPLNISGVEYGLHPRLTNIKNMFDQGSAAWISNVGTLIKPTEKNDFFNDNVPIPLSLFSHSDQSNQWMTAIPYERSNRGWAGRLSDLIQDINSEKSISMNVSLAGTNLFQRSERSTEFTVTNDGAELLSGYTEMYNFGPIRKDAVDKLLNHNYQDPFKNNYVQIFKNSLDSSLRFNKILNETPALTTVFDSNYLNQNFEMITQIIAAREQMGFKRQIFFVDFGGWDTHDELLTEQDYLLLRLDSAMGEFSQGLREIGMTDNVVTFTMSEFGRTLTSNGNGTDHAWGGNMFVFGGPVRGNRIYGTYPSLVLDGDLDIGNGSLIPTTATDLYFAELALWFGVAPSDLHAVLPNLHNFYAPGSTQNPLGFLNI
jgi:uncharacterized protein (DUF1501 family)